MKLIPSYARLPLAAVVAVNSLVYWGARVIAGDRVHVNMEMALDRLIPFVPWTIVIYFGCYVFWIANYILCAHLGKAYALRFYASDILAKIICFLFFVFLPTTIVRPEITGSGLAERAVAFLYEIDAADNLFPSIHCLVSWLCFIGVRGQARVPKYYQVLSLIFAVLVCISTVTLKQHAAVDIAGGILLAELAYYLTGRMFAHGESYDKR